MKNKRSTPIAIVGMGCMFPQAANLEQYWDNIMREVDCITEVPPSRWDIRDYYDSDPTAPDKTYCRRGGFLPDIEFNPMEFGMPPNILEVTDSSQILSLVVAKQALADAGYGQSEECDYTRTGVILGAGGGQKLAIPLSARLQYPIWERVLRQYGIPEHDLPSIIETMKAAYIRWEENSFPGSLGNVIAGRIANRFNLGGINCTVDAACASSLGGLQMAVGELDGYRADMMISGGVDTDNSIFMYMCFSKTPAFSRRNQSTPFDADSDGMLAAEGLGMVVLKRLEDAERDGDRIYAVIKGIGSSSDGRHKSIYAPSASGQITALRRAYRDAGISPATIGLFEAHGTGTLVGDPIEIDAIREVFHRNGDQIRHIALGSVKSQIGHTGAAAGAASLIKAALALHHRILPATIHITTPDPSLQLETSPFYLNTETRPWFRTEANTPRCAGISSFGFGGTNFHVVLEEHPRTRQEAGSSVRLPVPLVLNSSTPDQLLVRCTKLLSELTSEQGGQAYEKLLASTETEEISEHAARVGLVSVTQKELCDSLQLFIDTLQSRPNQDKWELSQGIFYRRNAEEVRGKVVALFSGQGAQYLNMGRELALYFPLFREAYHAMDHVLVNENLLPVSSLVFPPPVFTKEERNAQSAILRGTENAQPAIGAFSVGVYRLLQQAGFTPDFAAGHSFGELTALWAAGVLRDEDFFSLVKSRGQAMAGLPDPGFESGTMLAVKGEPGEIQDAISDFPDIVIANWNSRTQMVLAGPIAAMARAQQKFQSHRIATIPLSVSAAFHTPLVAYAQKPFARAVEVAQLYPAAMPVYSNASAMRYSDNPDEITQTLIDHMLNPVKFKQQVENMYADGGRVFVEIGPGNVLTRFVENILQGKEHVAVACNPSSKGRKDGVRQLFEAIAQLRVAGIPLRGMDPASGKNMNSPAQRRSGLTIRLNGSNHVSEKTQEAFEKALETLAPAKMPAADQSADILRNEGGQKQDSKTISRPLAGTEGQIIRQRHQKMMPSSSKTLFTRKKNATTATQQHYLKTAGDITHAYADLIQKHFELLTHKNCTPAMQESFERVLGQFHEYQMHTQQNCAFYLEHNPSDESDFSITGPVSHPETSSDHIPPMEAKTPEIEPISFRSSPPIRDVPSIAMSEEEQPSEIHQTSDTPTETGTGQLPLLPDFETLSQSMLAVVSDKTGYPMDSIELDMDIDADLGIDSIKRVEILGEFQELYPDLPPLKPEELADLRTLGEIVESLKKQNQLLTDQPEIPTDERKTQEAPPLYSGIHQVPTLHDPAAIQQAGLREKLLPPPDQLLELTTGQPICLITDDGGKIAPKLAQAFLDLNWKVLALVLPDSLVPEKSVFPEHVKCIDVKHTDEQHLQHQFQTFFQSHETLNAFVYLHPIHEMISLSPQEEQKCIEKETELIKLVFLLAKHLKAPLSVASQQGRGAFVTVSRMDGLFGLSSGVDWCPVNGGFTGLTNTLNQEWEDAFCRAIDVDRKLDVRAAVKAIIAELYDPNLLLTEVGYNSVKGRCTRATTPLQADETGSESASSISPSSVFLVSGGGRGITAQCTIALAQHTHGSFIILGRTVLEPEPQWVQGCQDEAELKQRIMTHLREQGTAPAPQEIQRTFNRLSARREISATIQAIKDAGGKVEYVNVDITDEVALREALVRMEKRLAPITGIIHGAGVLRDKMIENKTSEDFDAVYAPKVTGLYNLLHCVEPQKLRHLAIFSSIAGVYGNAGQSDYAIANAVMDSFAHRFCRQYPECHAVSFNWGPWEGGMVTPELQRIFAKRNIPLIPVSVGTRIFAEGVASDLHKSAQIVVGSPLSRRNGARRPVLSHHGISRRLSVQGNPFLHDHIIGGVPVLPTAFALGWVATVAEQLYPGYRVFQSDYFKVNKGIVFDETLTDQYILDLRETGHSNEDDEIHLTVKIWSETENGKRFQHYDCQLSLSLTAPPGPIHSPIDLTEQPQAQQIPLYHGDDAFLFHGPSFQGIQRILNISEQGLTMACLLPSVSEETIPIQFNSQGLNAVAMDVNFQALLVWLMHFLHPVGLPLGSGAARFFRPVPSGEPFYVTMRVRSLTENKLVADLISHDREGRMYTALHDASVTLSNRLNSRVVPFRPQEERGVASRRRLSKLSSGTDKKIQVSSPQKVLWDYDALVEFAGGQISRVFGPEYAVIDSYPRRARLPLPPYLFASRVIDIKAERGRFEPSSITLEYDIPQNAWYSVDGHVPWAIAVEVGQCNMFLVSYIGADFENKGKYIYRVLGGTLTFFNELPKEGDTLRFTVGVTSFVKQGENLMFFFNYEGFVGQKRLLRMEEGSAGFFSEEQITHGKGVVFSDQELEKRKNIEKQTFEPLLVCRKQAFTKTDIRHLVDGNPDACFGDHYWQEGENPSLRLPPRKMLMLDRVISVDPAGGAWGLGLIVAEKDFTPDDWFFACHFQDDHVLPGTLVGEGCGQLLQFYTLYLGLQSLMVDARFQPIPDLKQNSQCRGQVTPDCQKITYRLEVTEIGLTPEPYIRGNIDILLDGTIIIHFHNGGVRLHENHPDTQAMAPPPGPRESQWKKRAPESILFSKECIEDLSLGGAYSKYLGQDFSIYDSGKLQISRVPNTHLCLIHDVVGGWAERFQFTKGSTIQTEYDVPLMPWYYRQNRGPSLPYSILMEFALQPSGFLSIQLGTSLLCPDRSLFIRNLDGTARLLNEVDVRGKTVTNSTCLVSSTNLDGMVLQKFAFQLACDEQLFYEGEIVFGQFSPSTLDRQVGLDGGRDVRPWYETENIDKLPAIDLNLRHIQSRRTVQHVTEKTPFYGLARHQLDLLHTVKIIEQGGRYQRGYIHAARTINPNDWYFKCHFYQDPVMPGSSGIEAVLQAMRVYALHLDAGKHMTSPYFRQPSDHKTAWKYRGQIPEGETTMSLEVHISKCEVQEEQVVLVGDASVWKPGMRIYEVKDAAVCIRDWNKDG